MTNRDKAEAIVVSHARNLGAGNFRGADDRLRQAIESALNEVGLKWIRTSERVPQDHIKVLAWRVPTGEVVLERQKAHNMEVKRWANLWTNEGVSDSTVTHWQPLPPIPTTQEEEGKQGS